MTEPDVVRLNLTPKLIFRIILRLAIVIGALAAILFISAGRLDWEHRIVPLCTSRAWFLVGCYPWIVDRCFIYRTYGFGRSNAQG
ncbi:MAG: hypothetical protein KAS36_06780 [Anaerolineales bacterium]|nr:hypothetical protein [Anaerolineales bacterium]